MVNLTRFSSDGATHSQLNSQDGITISVTNPIASAIKGANIILRRRCSHKMIGCRCSTRHLAWYVGVQGCARDLHMSWRARMSTDITSRRWIMLRLSMSLPSIRRSFFVAGIRRGWVREVFLLLMMMLLLRLLILRRSWIITRRRRRVMISLLTSWWRRKGLLTYRSCQHVQLAHEKR